MILHYNHCNGYGQIFVENLLQNLRFCVETVLFRLTIIIITGNGVNVLAMGAFYVASQMGCDIADAYLNAELGSGYEWWYNFYEFHKLAIDELEAFDYDEYKKNGFKMEHLCDYPLKLEKKPENV